VRSCFSDIAEALSAAQDFIYICGWSMHPETRLTRSGSSGGERIGELLKRKAAEKVTVCLLVRPLTNFSPHLPAGRLRHAGAPCSHIFSGPARWAIRWKRVRWRYACSNHSKYQNWPQCWMGELLSLLDSDTPIVAARPGCRC
jgi:hypothetical protein